MEIKKLIKRIRSKRGVGYVYAPYIITQNISIISGSYSAAKFLNAFVAFNGGTKNSKVIDSNLYSKIIVKDESTL